jgi:hypothetical protein
MLEKGQVCLCFLYIIKITVEEWPIALPQGHKVESKFQKREKVTYYILGCLQFVWTEFLKYQ